MEGASRFWWVQLEILHPQEIIHQRLVDRSALAHLAILVVLLLTMRVVSH